MPNEQKLDDLLFAWLYAHQDAMAGRAPAEATAAPYQAVLDRFASGERAERRLHALRVHLDCEGSATFTVWANEMIELEGLWQDEDESIPAMFDSLDELLDCLYEVVSTPTDASGSPGRSTIAGSNQMSNKDLTTIANG